MTTTERRLFTTSCA